MGAFENYCGDVTYELVDGNTNYLTFDSNTLELTVYSSDPSVAASSPYTHTLRVAITNTDFPTVHHLESFVIEVTDCPNSFDVTEPTNTFNLITNAAPVYYVIDQDTPVDLDF